MSPTLLCKLLAALLVPACLPAQSGGGEPPKPLRLFSGVSVVDYLKANKLSSDDAARAALYKQRCGDEKYTGSTAQNLRLLESLMLEDANQAKETTCVIDDVAVVLDGVRTLRDFKALGGAGLRVARLDRVAPSEEKRDRFFVIFSARETSLLADKTVGHAWIALAIQGRDEAQCRGRAFGQYRTHTDDALRSAFEPVPGGLVGGWRHNSAHSAEKLRFVVEVDVANYLAARDALADAKADGTYQLVGNDCTDLVNRVATAAGLRPAPRSPATAARAGAAESSLGQQPDPRSPAGPLLPTEVVEALIILNLPRPTDR
jgi:hypothetical protein